VTADSFPIVVGPELQVTGRYYAASEPAVKALLVLAHGAGAGQDHPFMVGAARGFAARGLATVTFNFPYMERKSRGAPNPAPQLEACYRAVIAAVRDRGWLGRNALVIGGKSMGGRMASHIAADPASLPAPVAGLVFLGYPLHPPGKPTQLRSAHLPSIVAPMLFVQGSKDTFGTPADLAPILAPLAAPSTVIPIEGGDHSFKVTSNKDKQAAVIDRILDDVVAWIRRVDGTPQASR
jgi:predicted alpha/beta-hydrolase family hydrolase